jgi:RNA polymerase sigma-70 factor (ECF subfamily)
MNAALHFPSMGFSRAPLDPDGGFTLVLPQRRRGDPFGPSPRARTMADPGLKESRTSQVKVESADPLDSSPAQLALWLQAVAQRQDREAFARLHAHFSPRLAAWLAKSGLSATQAEEVVQETMISVWRKAGQYDPALSGASTWIFVIARNLRVDMQRRRSNREMAPLEDWDQIDDSPTGEEILLTSERESKLRQALSRLSPEQANVLEQAYFAEKPQSAIARDLGVPLGTVKSRVRLALARLKQYLEESP